LSSLSRSAGATPAGQRLARDPRIDLLRGFALLTIFIDHVPDNPLNLLTLRNFGFSDAAELFVVLAGVSSMIAYGRCFERDGARPGLRRVLLRCGRIYLFQVGLLLTTLAIVHLWRQHFGLEDPIGMAAFFEQPLAAIGHALALHALPASLNILPLYIVLLAGFPLIYAGMRVAPALTLGLSGVLWLSVNIDHRINLTNWLDGEGWFFNPFAWQFLFTIGVFGAVVLRASGGELPRHRLLVRASWAYILIALLLAAPWTAWGLSDLRLLSFAPPDKTTLSPVRLLDILALVYLALSSAGLRRMAGGAWARPVVACGKHSLEVFAFATLIAIVFRLLFYTLGPLWPLQVAVNVVGLGAILAFGILLERQGGTPAWQSQLAGTRLT
jgi:hypothetical protein